MIGNGIADVVVFGLLLQVTRESSYPYEEFRVHIATWNVASTDPPEKLGPFLGIDGGNPDIIVIGLQEITMRPDVALLNGIISDKWTKEFDLKLGHRNYKRVATERLIGLAINVFVKSNLEGSIKSVETSELKTGSHGLYGNKGAVSVSFELFSKKIRFINCHLPAHDSGYIHRLRDYHHIHHEFASQVPFDYEFWFGDLNFRLTDPLLTGEQIQEMVGKGQIEKLFFRDELTWARNQSVGFSDLGEQDVGFDPTFKFHPGTDQYNLKRRPAWTDRILYSLKGGIKPVLYKSLPEYKNSDHKPVIAEFTIDVS